MSARELSCTEAYQVEAARKLLADVASMGYEDTGEAYRLLGRAQVVIAGLVETIQEAQR